MYAYRGKTRSHSKAKQKLMRQKQALRFQTSKTPAPVSGHDKSTKISTHQHALETLKSNENVDGWAVRVHVPTTTNTTQ